MIKLFINAIGLATNGIPDWNTGCKIIRDQIAYSPMPLDYYKPQLLPANERRRATSLIRLAFRVCEEIYNNHTDTVHNAISIFASSGGDYQIIDRICRELCEPNRSLSPTQFHNSVHNSAAGYWSIATQSTAPSTSLSCYDFTFAAALLEAAAIVNDSKQPVLLTAYDIETPSPLDAKRKINFPFAVAMLLDAEVSNPSMAYIALNTCGEERESSCTNKDLELLRTGNPAARALPLLESIANRKEGRVVLNLPDAMKLALDVGFVK